MLKMIKRAAAGLWALTFPVTLKRIGAFLLSAITLTGFLPQAARLFPSAKDHLKKKGLNTALVDQLAPGENVHVLEGTGGNALNAFYMSDLIPRPDWMPLRPVIPFPPMIAFNFAVLKLLPDAHAVKGGLSGICAVTLDDEAHLARKGMLSRMLHIPKDELNPPVLSEKEFSTYVTLHEIRHCSDDNGKIPASKDGERDPLLAEGDADYRAATAAAIEYSNPEIIRWVFNWRAARVPGEDAEHDVSLYLDAVINKRQPPTVEEIKAANKAAGDFFDNDLNGKKVTDEAAEKFKNGLSPLAQKRIVLFLEGQKYFGRPL